MKNKWIGNQFFNEAESNENLKKNKTNKEEAEEEHFQLMVLKWCSNL